MIFVYLSWLIFFNIIWMCIWKEKNLLNSGPPNLKSWIRPWFWVVFLLLLDIEKRVREIERESHKVREEREFFFLKFCTDCSVCSKWNLLTFLLQVSLYSKHQQQRYPRNQLLTGLFQIMKPNSTSSHLAYCLLKLFAIWLPYYSPV